MQASEAKPSVPVIAYLYAHRLIPKDSIPIWGTRVPCTDIRVRTDGLAILLFATAFWNLRQQGLIDMAVLQSPRARGFFSRTEV